MSEMFCSSENSLQKSISHFLTNSLIINIIGFVKTREKSMYDYLPLQTRMFHNDFCKLRSNSSCNRVGFTMINPTLMEVCYHLLLHLPIKLQTAYMTVTLFNSEIFPKYPIISSYCFFHRLDMYLAWVLLYVLAEYTYSITDDDCNW